METGRQAIHEADEFVHQNPVPAIVGALVIGFVLGLLARSPEKPTSRLDDLRSRLEESESDLRTLLGQITKQAKKKYKKGSGVVRDSLDRAADVVNDIDVDDYIDPASKWFKKLWRKYVA